MSPAQTSDSRGAAHQPDRAYVWVWLPGAVEPVVAGDRATVVADDGTLDEMEMEPFELTGLYEGIPLTEKSSWDVPQGPDTVWLFRRPILDEWAERGNVTIAELVTHVTIHEFAHHFGWSDDDIAAIDQWWH